MTIGFSIPVYKDPNRVLKQLYSLEKNKGDMNFLYGLHVNATDDIEYFKNILLADRIVGDKIFFSKIRQPLKQRDNFFCVHIDIFRSFPVKIDKIVLVSANEMYIRGGKELEHIFENFSHGFYLDENGKYAKHYYDNDILFKKCIDTVKSTVFLVSQWEGTFYSYEIFEQIATIIEKNYDTSFYYKADGKGNIDETIFPTMSFALENSKPFYPLCRADHVQAKDIPLASMKVIKNILDEKIIEKDGQPCFFCSIKRVPVENHTFADKILGLYDKVEEKPIFNNDTVITNVDISLLNENERKIYLEKDKNA